ncbi:uncharacterized protein LOC135082045 [Ostrinia nubilalis]|uniref:uncharacterized protein LOC135082045 n=1 Tax=Ostrinia nubilalis TaxID=29057 RepID=UPI0030822784
MMLIVILMSIISLKESEGMVNDLHKQNISTENWTTCDTFLQNATYDQISVVDVDWIIFYFWSMHFERSYHIRFSIPSKVLVDRFRVELNDVIEPRVNWTESELFVETSIDLSGLFIRTETPGKFRFIPSLAFRYRSAPYLLFALKMVDGFLGMMNCKHKQAYALAPIRSLNQLKPQDMEAAAKKMGFWNPFGRSYLMKSKSFEDPAPLPPLEDIDDAEDDIQIELDREQNRFQII